MSERLSITLTERLLNVLEVLQVWNRETRWVATRGIGIRKNGSCYDPIPIE